MFKIDQFFLPFTLERQFEIENLFELVLEFEFWDNAHIHTHVQLLVEVDLLNRNSYMHMHIEQMDFSRLFLLIW